MPTPYKAIPCQGFTFTWGGSALYSVQQLEVDLAKGLPVGRTLPSSGTAATSQYTISRPYSPKQGTVRLVGFHPINLPYSEYGRRRTLSITCPDRDNGGTITLLNQDCIYQDVNVQATANNAALFAYVFSVMDTVGAPTA